MFLSCIKWYLRVNARARPNEGIDKEKKKSKLSRLAQRKQFHRVATKTYNELFRQRIPEASFAAYTKCNCQKCFMEANFLELENGHKASFDAFSSSHTLFLFLFFMSYSVRCVFINKIILHFSIIFALPVFFAVAASFSSEKNPKRPIV